MCALLRILNDLNESMDEACEAGDFDRANAFAVAGDIVAGRVVDLWQETFGGSAVSS